MNRPTCNGWRKNDFVRPRPFSPDAGGQAYYLAGYAVECGLKSCIAKAMKAEDFLDKGFAERCWTRLRTAGLLYRFKAIRDADAAADADLSRNWGTVKDWNESSRYLRQTKAKAVALYKAITEGKHGVLPWIKSRW